MSIATWIELAVALATALLAGATWWMARKTTVAAEATKRDAEASQIAAEATRESAAAAQATVAEMQRTRALDWRPYISVSLGKVAKEPRPGGGHIISVEYTATNLGRGPALRCVCGAYSQGLVALTTAFDLAAGAQTPSERCSSQGVASTPDLRPMFIAATGSDQEGRAIAICRDGLLGHWYRFVVGCVEPDEWDPSATPAPEWVILIRTAVPDLAKDAPQ